jgi:AAA15 family ATPase/GTPase
MGDGMNRLLGITLALAVVSGGILLVDEIENGIHYSVQTDVWRTILRAAESLNVQVFATTHSWDCIRAFAAATNEMEGTAGILYRLDRRIKGEVRPVRYTQEEMAIAAEQQIEVR